MEDVKGCKVDEEIININETFKCSHDDAIIKEDELLESTKLEMTGVKQENVRLKTLLQKIENDYKTLQTQLIDVLQQESKKNEVPTFVAQNINQEEQELVSLRLGMNTPIQSKKENNIHVTSVSKNSNKVTCEKLDGVIELGLVYNHDRLKTSDGPISLGTKCPGPDNNYSFTEKKELDDKKWAPNKVMKTERSGDEDFSQTSVKRARVCVRAKCDTPTMNDGCQWRKYGQKIAKGNPCPRAYYRCTVSPSCPVRKQVQRCMEDTSILITTYEGAHNHPLPISATAMASTTSAAASMLLSSSTTSPPSPLNLYTPPPATYIPTTPFSTVTLDLTTNPTTTATTTTHGGFSLYSNSSPQQNPRFSPMWGNLGFPYGTIPANNNYSNLLPGKVNQASSQQALTESLTKVITSDPSFRSVIAAVVSTMAGNGGEGKN